MKRQSIIIVIGIRLSACAGTSTAPPEEIRIEPPEAPVEIHVEAPVVEKEWPKAGAQAIALAERLAKEEQLPCPTYVVGQPVMIGGFEYTFGETIVAPAEENSPWVTDRRERETFRGGKPGLVVPFTLTNRGDKARKTPVRRHLWTTDGEKIDPTPGNSRIAARERYGVSTWDLREVDPNQTVQSAWVFPITEENANNPGLQLFAQEKQTTPEGRKVTVKTEMAVVDLGMSTKGEHINPHKRSR